MRDFVRASGMRVWWWFDSCGANLHPLPPFVTAKGFDLHHRVPQRGKKIPRTPSRRRATLAATINTQMQCSNISFEQWIFYHAKPYNLIYFELKRECRKNIKFCTTPFFDGFSGVQLLSLRHIRISTEDVGVPQVLFACSAPVFGR